jgi:hypothetical protein
MSLPDPPAQNDLAPEDRLLCLTVLGYRKAGMDEEAYRKHMTEVSAPLTKDLLVKYGILRWTQVYLSTTLSFPLHAIDLLHQPILLRLSRPPKNSKKHPAKLILLFHSENRSTTRNAHATSCTK